MKSKNESIIEFESALMALVHANASELTPTEIIGALELVKLTFMELSVSTVIRKNSEGMI